tara:strand:- start:12800 stop:13414 length:615 start_codon:yes stop_codon:yes gene_type:complete
MFKTETTYFTPDDKKKPSGPIPKGKWYAMVIDVDKVLTDKMITSRHDKTVTHLADKYIFRYRLHEDNEGMSFEDTDGNEVLGDDYVGYEVKSNSIWVWKKSDDPNVTPNDAGNFRYSTVLKAVDYPFNVVEMEDNKGEMKKRYELPVDIDDSEIVGKRVIIDVIHNDYSFTNDAGELKEGTSSKELGVYKWEGEPKNNKDSVPF